MTIVEAYDLEIVKQSGNKTLIRKDCEEQWVKTEFLEVKADPTDPEDWASWITEAYCGD